MKKIRKKEEENSDVKWFDLDKINDENIVGFTKNRVKRMVKKIKTLK